MSLRDHPAIRSIEDHPTRAVVVAVVVAVALAAFVLLRSPGPATPPPDPSPTVGASTGTGPTEECAAALDATRAAMAAPGASLSEVTSSGLAAQGVCDPAVFEEFRSNEVAAFIETQSSNGG